jgi:hypothetical protein
MTEIESAVKHYRPDRATAHWQRKRRSISTPTQLAWLHNEIYSELYALRARAVLIDNAQAIDHTTLMSLLQLYQRLARHGRPCALILAVRLEKHEAHI